MLSNLFLKLTIFFREKYISSLETFTLKADPNELKQEIYKKLPEYMRTQLDIEIAVYAEVENKLNQAKQHWDKQVEETDNKRPGMLGKMTYEASQRQASTYNRAINNRGQRKLYLVGFDKNLTSRQAKFELLRLGFCPADILETVLFFQKYLEDLHKYGLPIISLEAHFDEDKKVGLLENGLYALCLCSSLPPYFSGAGSIESSEFLEGATFRPGILFLVKPV
jgi:hypothetical protein